MSKNVSLFICSLLIFCQAAVALAELLPLTVNWSYSGAAVSYILYKDGVQVCISSDSALQEMTCEVFIEDVPMVFTLSAVDVDGVESPQSAPYTLNPPVKDAFGNYIPQPSIDVDRTSGTVPLPVSFDASGSVDVLGSIVSFLWDFGDGDIGSGALINHTFATSGSYIVTLSVEDNDGAVAETTVTINVTSAGTPLAAPNVAPVAVLTATPLPNLPSRIGFDAYSSSDSDGTITTFSWDFGDGDTAVGEYVEHEFLTVGDYTVILTIVDDGGASAQDQMIISVVDPPLANTPPVAALSASTVQHRLHFDWDFAAGLDLAGFNLYQNGIKICSVADPTARQTDCLAYVDSGIVEYWLTSYDVNGVESGPSQIFVFDSALLQPSGATGDAPLPVFFSSGGTFDTDGTIVSYEWDFGDGAVAAGVTAQHTFDLPGIYTVTLTVTDDAGDRAQAITAITVTGEVNEPPVATAASFVTDEDKLITATLSGADPEGRALTYVLTGNGSLGTATITNPVQGVFTYVPQAGVSGSDSFSFKVNDGVQDSQPAHVAITVNSVNELPVAQASSISTQEDQPIRGVLAATDGDGDKLTYLLVTNPGHGTATLDAATGAFIYTPTVNANGVDSFTFAANDGTGNSAAAVVTVTILPVNDSPVAGNDSAVTQEDTAVTIDLAGNDSDVDGDTLSYSLDVLPTNGTVTLSGAVAVYEPGMNFNGSDQFSYVVSDPAGLTATAQVAVTITSVNDDPIAAFTSNAFVTSGERLFHVEWEYPQDATVAGFRLYLDGLKVCETFDPAARSLDCVVATETTEAQIALTAFDSSNIETTPVEITAPLGALLRSGVNEGLMPLTLIFDASSSTDSDGSVSSYEWDFGDGIQASGQRVEHLFNNSGVFVVQLTVSDDAGGRSTSQQPINVTKLNAAPVALIMDFLTAEDTVLNSVLTASDPDNDILTYTIVRQPSNGQLSLLSTDGSQFTYSPNSNYHGTDSFTYKVNDGTVDSDTAIATITITPVNDLPVAEADAASTDEDTPVTIDVLANDSDVDGDSLAVGSVSPAGNGTVELVGSIVTYRPNQNYNGADSFTYEVSDGKGGSVQGSVFVTVQAVNDMPSVSAVAVVTREDMPTTGQLSASDPDNDTLRYYVVGDTTNGKVGIVDPTSPQFIYSPNQDFNGTDSFTYKVNDGLVDSSVATVNITITSVNDAPVALADTVSTDEDTAVTIDVLANDSDVDGNMLSFIGVSTGKHGSVSQAGASIIYTPEENFNGMDAFSYIIGDGHGGSANAIVTVTVVPVNDAPVVPPLASTTVSGVMSVIDVLQSATDVDGDALTVASVAASMNASAVIVDGRVEYTANPGFWGDDNLTYMISDGKGGQTSGAVVITVEQPMSLITFSWDFDATVSVSGFNFYRNGTKICATNESSRREFKCTAPVLEGPQSFAITAVDGAGVETTLSNLIQYGVAALPIIEPQPLPVADPRQLITYVWTYTGDSSNLAGFKLYVDGATICETSDPAARTLSCTIPQTTASKVFTLTSIDTSGVESAFSNSIQY